jgi:hypothetical protein
VLVPQFARSMHWPGPRQAVVEPQNSLALQSAFEPHDTEPGSEYAGSVVGCGQSVAARDGEMHVPSRMQQTCPMPHFVPGHLPPLVPPVPAVPEAPATLEPPVPADGLGMVAGSSPARSRGTRPHAPESAIVHSRPMHPSADDLYISGRLTDVIGHGVA